MRPYFTEISRKYSGALPYPTARASKAHRPTYYTTCLCRYTLFEMDPRLERGLLALQAWAALGDVCVNARCALLLGGFAGPRVDPEAEARLQVLKRKTRKNKR